MKCRECGKKGKLLNGRRGLRIFLPFLLLALGFAFLSEFQEQSSRNPDSHDTAVDLKSDPLLTPTLSVFASGTPSPSGPASVTPNTTPSAKGLRPGNPPTTVAETVTSIPPTSIQINGPPEDSVFSFQTPLTIYWEWPFDQDESQRFTVYLQDEFGDYLAGMLNEPSLGDQGYQLSFVPADVVQSEGTYLVQIRLEYVEQQVIIATSKPRAIMFTREISG